MSDIRKTGISLAELDDFSVLLSVTHLKSKGFASKTAFLLFPAGLPQLRLNVIPPSQEHSAKKDNVTTRQSATLVKRLLHASAWPIATGHDLMSRPDHPPLLLKPVT